MLYNVTTVEDTTSITRYERAHRLEVSNPLGGTPQIMFVTSWVELDNETGIETQRRCIVTCQTLLLISPRRLRYMMQRVIAQVRLLTAM